MDSTQTDALNNVDNGVYAGVYARGHSCVVTAAFRNGDFCAPLAALGTWEGVVTSLLTSGVFVLLQ